MYVPSITKLAGPDAAGAGVLLLANAPGVASPDDAAYTDMFDALIARARAVQGELGVVVATVTTAEDAHEKKVEAARGEEKTLDSASSALHTRLLAEVKAGTPGAQELLDLIFRDGLDALRRPKGRAQLSRYLAWLEILASASATSNPAYPLIADKVAAFRASVQAFSLTLQEKDALDAALTAARTARDEVQARWTAAFRILIGVAADKHGADSDAFRGWIRPVLDWKASQDAAATRRANAAKDTPDGGGQSAA